LYRTTSQASKIEVRPSCRRK